MTFLHATIMTWGAVAVVGFLLRVVVRTTARGHRLAALTVAGLTGAAAAFSYMAIMRVLA